MHPKMVLPCILFILYPLLIHAAVNNANGAKNLTDLPPAAQVAVSTTFGRNDTAYHARHSRGGGFRMENPDHSLFAEFADVATITCGAARWNVSLAAVGRDGRLEPVKGAKPRALANRIEYLHDGVTEWYINGPLGLEQGFTIGKRPGGSTGAGLDIVLASGGMRPVLAEDGRTFLLQRSDKTAVLRYGGLMAWDAEGRTLPARPFLKDGQIVLRVDDRGARYPVTVDPMLQNVRLTASDGATPDYFGSAVALSGDGTIALIGAPSKKVGGKILQGAGYIFIRSGAAWEQEAELTASDGMANDFFGSSVALSSDGAIALIGTPYKSVGGKSGQGAAYVFTRSGTTWSQQAELSAPDGAAEDRFGLSVAVSSDGATALIGARNKDIDGNNGQGAAYIFTRSDTVWNQQAVLTAADGVAYDGFGSQVALSSSGSTVLIGAGNKSAGHYGVSDNGAAYVFTRAGTAWSQEAELFATDGHDYDFFGLYSLALSGDGSIAMIGTPYQFTGSENTGSVYVFSRTDAAWSQQVKLIGATGQEGFGYTVALNGDGTAALIGAPSKTVGGIVQQGAAYLYSRSGSAWNQADVLLPADGAAHDNFGHSVALSSDGTIALIAAYAKTVGVNDRQGAAYVFSSSLGPSSPTVATAPASNVGYFGAQLNGSVNANGADATVTFEYGTTSSYGKSVAATPPVVTGSADATVSASIGGLNDGRVYHFRAVANNSAGTSYGLDRTFKTNTAPPATGVSLVPDPPSPQPAGTNIVFTASASGGSGNFEYQFWVKYPGAVSWVLGQAYDASPTWLWNTTGLINGTYQIQVWARNTSSTANAHAYRVMNYTIGVPLAVDFTAVSPPSPQSAGTEIDLTATATGGAGSYQYQFWVKYPGAASWTLGQAFGANPTWKWNTTGLMNGTYQVQLWAKNAPSSFTTEAYRLMNYTLGTPLGVSFTEVSPPSPQLSGTNITFKAKATGGSGSYLYQFWVKYPGTASWTLGQAYETGGTWVWSTAGLAKGVYQIQLWGRNAASSFTTEAVRLTSFTLQ